MSLGTCEFESRPRHQKQISLFFANNYQKKLVFITFLPKMWNSPIPTKQTMKQQALRLFLLPLFTFFFSTLICNGQEDAAAASATGSAAAPAKGAPKAAQANNQLRTLHIAVHKLGLTSDQLKTALASGGLDGLRKTYKDALEGGASFAEFKTHGKSLAMGLVDNFADAKEHGDLVLQGVSLQDAKDHGDLLRAGHTLEDAKAYGDLLRANSDLSVEEALAAAKADPTNLLSVAKDAVIAKYNSSYSYNVALESAMVLATSILTDRTITSTLPAVSVTLDNILSGGGYNFEFIRLLSSYGAIGSNGDTLAAAILGADYSEYAKGGLLSYGAIGSNGDTLAAAILGSDYGGGEYAKGGLLSDFVSTSASTKDFMVKDPVSQKGLLYALTGVREFHSDDASSTLFDIPLSNVSLSPGSNITLGAAGSDSTIDVSGKLSPASSSKDRKILIVGAAKDLNLAGNVKFTNSNDAEDHALVLGAADDVIIDGSDIEYTGSNLAIGAGGTDADSMYLVNTTISTGGNLAAGSLGNLNISNANFNVGLANSATSDPDNIYLYANEKIVVDNMVTSGGRIDDIYMESKTIHIKNTSFPAVAEVMLRSQAGSLHIQNSSSDIQAGGVNFYKVKHLGISNSDLTRDQFSGVDGHINSVAPPLPNGTPHIRIRAQ